MKCKAVVGRIGNIGNVLTFLMLSICSGVAIADAPTESEWLAWPHFCKAGFLSSYWAKEVGSYSGQLSNEQVANFQRVQEQTVGIPGIHHFCMGMTYTNRAKAMGVNSKVGYFLGRAINEIHYSLSKMNSSAPRYSLVTAYYGTALYLSGKRQQAMETWDKGIEAKPASRESYLAKAEVLLKEKKAKEALEVLQRYEQAKDVDAPDAEAFLSHTYLELGEFEKAREHADKAYQLGYPLPGLRNKLERLSGKK